MKLPFLDTLVLAPLLVAIQKALYVSNASNPCKTSPGIEKKKISTQVDASPCEKVKK